MKNTLIIILLAIAGTVSAQQTIPLQYDYDAAGNRILRKVVTMTMGKGGSNVADTAEYYVDRLEHVEMKVYPNPTTGLISIEASGVQTESEMQIELYDSQGRKLTEKRSGDNRAILNLTDYAAGYYIVKLKVDGEHTTWKVIKQ